jgi:hypothetical protein
VWIVAALILALVIGGALTLAVTGLVRAGRDAAGRIAARPSSATAETEAAKTADDETKKAIAEVQRESPRGLLDRARRLRDLGRAGK